MQGNQVESVAFDSSTGLAMITPVEGYVYTDEEGKEHTGEKLELYTVRLQDERLLALLDEHGVDYTSPYVPQMPFLLSFLISYLGI